MLSNLSKTTLSIILAISLTAFACDEESHHHDHNPDAHVCEHFEDLTKAQSLTGAESADTATLLESAHKLYKLSLKKEADATQYSGFVKINASSIGELTLASSSANLIIGAKQGNAALELVKSANTKCNLTHYKVDITVVGALLLEIKNDSDSAILLYELHSHDEAHEDGHAHAH